MLTLPNKPESSAIEEMGVEDGVILSWKTPSGGIGRYGVAAFLAFWLCGWAFGEIFVLGALLGGGLGGASLFLIGWLGAWTVGGAFAISALWHLLRSPRPESINLGVDRFRHDPGSGYLAWSYYNAGNPSHAGTYPSVFERRKPVEVDKTDIKEFKLDRVGERQRLTFDQGSKRIEIGPTLSEPEREWLHEVLEAWRTV